MLKFPANYGFQEIFLKKSLKIPKGQSEAVNRRRTDNTMAKRKRTNYDLQNIHRKLKDRVTRTPLKTEGKCSCSGRVSSSCPIRPYNYNFFLNLSI
jgi:hypothetical protein